MPECLLASSATGARSPSIGWWPDVHQNRPGPARLRPEGGDVSRQSTFDRLARGEGGDLPLTRRPDRRSPPSAPERGRPSDHQTVDREPVVALREAGDVGGLATALSPSSARLSLNEDAGARLHCSHLPLRPRKIPMGGWSSSRGPSTLWPSPSSPSGATRLTDTVQSPSRDGSCLLLSSTECSVSTTTHHLSPSTAMQRVASRRCGSCGESPIGVVHVLVARLPDEQDPASLLAERGESGFGAFVRSDGPIIYPVRGIRSQAVDPLDVVTRPTTDSTFTPFEAIGL